MFNKSDLRIEYMRGTGPGGQNKNKRETACRITHLPTGVTSYADTRTQESSYRMALAELEKRIQEAKDQKKAKEKKDRRDKAIHDHTVVRTYNFKDGMVYDHKTGKKASVKNVLEKGKLDLLREAGRE